LHKRKKNVVMSTADQKYIYFFPKITRAEADGLLGFRTLGTFLYRTSSSKIGGIVLSIKQRRNVLHILLQYSSEMKKYIFMAKGAIRSSMEKKSYERLAEITEDLKKRRLVAAGVVNPDHVPSNIPAEVAPDVMNEKTSAEVPRLGEQGKSALQEIMGLKRDLKDYKMMLRVFTMDKTLTESETKQLGEYRKAHNITMESHAKVLASLGISQETWDEYVAAGSKIEQKQVNEKQCTPTGDPTEWDEKTVIVWMETVSKKFKILPKTIDAFRGQDVTGDALLEIDRPMMMQLGITMGQANAVYKAVKALHST